MPARWGPTGWSVSATTPRKWAANRRRPKCCAMARRSYWNSMRPSVVVVGAGFGGLRAARALRRAPVDVLLVDRHNYHLFTPLLYQVATAGLEPEEIAHPVRAILRGRTNVRFLVAEVQRIDLAARAVRTSEGDLDYDYLVIAAGSTTNFFGVGGAERGAHGLKDADE